MAASRNRRYNQRAKERKKRARATAYLLAALAVAVVLFVVVRDKSQGAAPAQDLLQNGRPVAAAEAAPAATQEPTVTQAPVATQMPTASPDAEKPVVKLPVLRSVPVTGNQIAFTVDDCYLTKNVQKIVDLCESYGVKVTFFPVAQAIKNNPDLWREVYQMGYEIENHTYHHDKHLLDLDDAAIYKEIHEMDKLISRTLGVEYHMRFLRTPGGNARDDARVQSIMADLGYEYMSHWAISGTATKTHLLPDQLKPGQIVLFHATDSDVRKLESVLPIMVERGYQLVTLDALMGMEIGA